MGREVLTTAVFDAVVADKISNFQVKVKRKSTIMKKKLSVGQKREKILHYKFRQLKRAKIIPKEMSLKEFRGSESNSFVTKEVILTKKVGKEVTEFKRTVRIYVDPLPRKKKRKKPQQRPVAKAFRRKARKQLRAKFTKAMQKAKKLRRERRKAYEQEKHDRFQKDQEKRIQSDEDSGQVPDVRKKLSSAKE